MKGANTDAARRAQRIAEHQAVNLGAPERGGASPAKFVRRGDWRRRSGAGLPVEEGQGQSSPKWARLVQSSPRRSTPSRWATSQLTSSPPLIFPPTTPIGCSFLLAHRWALEGAHNLTVLAVASDGSTVRARCRFASPASIVAMKLQAAPRRTAGRAHKAGGDYFDIFRLVSHPALTRRIAQMLQSAPHDPGTWSADQIRAELVDQAVRTAAIIAQHGRGVLGPFRARSPPG